MAVPLGPTTTSRAVNHINANSMRPVPSVAPVPAMREPMVWVPERMVPVPSEGTVVVPGHWERRLEAREVQVPPLIGHNPETGAIRSFPGGIQPPSDERSSP